mgnify:CR=1 FL=1
MTNTLWILYVSGLCASLAACAQKTADMPATAAVSGAGQPAVVAAAGSGAAGSGAGACTIAPDCVDINTSFFQYPACCTKKYACGYEVAFTEEFLSVYPQARDLLARVAADDPNGKCAPDSFIFPIKPGTYDHRVELPGEPDADILVDAQCESRAVTVFSLPGCCMRDNRCGISTDEIAPTFQVLLEGEPAPFAEPECLTADALNEQLKATKLAAFGRIPPTSGAACDHAALAQKIPRYRQPGR